MPKRGAGSQRRFRRLLGLSRACRQMAAETRGLPLSCNVLLLDSDRAFEWFHKALSAEQLRDVTNVAILGRMVASFDKHNGWKDSVGYAQTMFPGLKRIFITMEAASLFKRFLGHGWEIETEQFEARAKKIFGIGQGRDNGCKIVTLRGHVL